MVEVDREPVLARRHHIESPVTVKVGDGEVNAEALAGAERAEVDDVFREGLAGPLEDIPAVGILVAAIALRVGAETLAGDEFVFAVAVDVDPLEVVILAAEGIDLVARPRALAGGVEPVVPPTETITVTLAEDQLVFCRRR